MSPREVELQCDLYRECLEQELNADPNCKDNYYILTYKGILHAEPNFTCGATLQKIDVLFHTTLFINYVRRLGGGGWSKN